VPSAPIKPSLKGLDLRAAVMASLSQTNPEMVAKIEESIKLRPVTSHKVRPVEVGAQQFRSARKENHHKFDQIDGGNKELSQRQIEREMQHERFVPTKRQSKRRGKMTKGTRSWFNAVALKGVPGASSSKAYAAIAQMYEEGTGCLVIDDMSTHGEALRKRLEHSAKHCNTTKGNYIVTIEH
jgi:hypothetical protein